jgi:hypothetical protein
MQAPTTMYAGGIAGRHYPSHRFVRYSNREGKRVPAEVATAGPPPRLRFQYDSSLGKGSHGRVWLEADSTILKDPKKELGTGLLRAMCRDLKIEPRDL